MERVVTEKSWQEKWIKGVMMVLTILLLEAGLLTGCEGKSNASVPAITREEKTFVSIHISADLESPCSVPDPAASGDTVEVNLNQMDRDIDYEERYQVEDSRDAYEAVQKKQFMDFSFLGLKRKARVLAYQVGTITDARTGEMSVSFHGYRQSREKELRQGNCLVLSLGVYYDKAEDNFNDEYFFSYEAAYLAVLDYRNKKSYLLKAADRMPYYNDSLSCYDLTGDGRDEIIYCNAPSRAIAWEVYQFDQGKLTPLVAQEGAFGEEFETSLLDGYRLKITASRFGYEKMISLEELGLKKSDMEIIPYSQIGKEDGLSISFRCYKKGKVCKRAKEVAYVESVLSDYWAYDTEEAWTCLTTGNAGDGLKLPFNIHLTKWITVGKAYAIVRYNEKTKQLEIADVDTEWRTINRKKELDWVK